MKRRILRAVKILTAYILLNIGVLSWIQVSAASGNRLNPAETVMAEIRREPGRCIEIRVLGESAVIDYSFVESDNVRTILLACADPAVLAVLDAVCYQTEKGLPTV